MVEQKEKRKVNISLAVSDILEILETALNKIKGQNRITQLQEYDKAFKSLLVLINFELDRKNKMSDFNRDEEKRNEKLALLDKFLHTVQKIENHTNLDCTFRRQVRQLLHETQRELSDLQFNREKGQQHEHTSKS